MPEASRSIRLRLIAAAALTISAALAVAGLGFQHLFARHVERRAVAELDTDVRQLIAGLTVSAEGLLSIEKPPGDQRYSQPFSGAYWQVTGNGVVIARSRSLWDEELALPGDVLSAGENHTHLAIGPLGQKLLARERSISVNRGGETVNYRLTAAIDRAEALAAISAFGIDLALGLSLLGAGLLAAFAVAVGVGLKPLSQLRDALIRLRAGHTRRLAGPFPQEVAPLVEDLNQLIEQRERSVAAARARAGDLAHGLKTPIAAISVIAEELEEQGQRETAHELKGYARAMQGHVEHELVRARGAAASEGGAGQPLGGIVEGLVRSLRRLPRGGELEWIVDIAPGIEVKVDKAAISEVIGNLLDNARKWAHGKVGIKASIEGEGLVIDVTDDGPGIPQSELQSVTARGRRLDESVPGSGFGLAIAADLVEQIGGRLALREACGGGLLARVRLPPARYHMHQ